MKKILVIGATSAIAEATARLYAADGDALFLVARDAQKLAAVAEDLRVRGASVVDTATMDVQDFARHATVVQEAVTRLDGLDLLLVAHGILPDQGECEASFEVARDALQINFGTVVSIVTRVANYMEEQRGGTIAVISSVAGDRGRKSNYIYGSTKAGVNAFLQGLRNRLFASGVQVLTIKPGFVDTPMTADIPDKGGALWASPDAIARGIYKAVQKRRDVVYLPGFWWLIMAVIRSIPEFIFKRLSL